MSPKQRLLIIDSQGILHRAFHALPPLTTKKGELVNAVYGFLLVFFRTLKEFQPDFVVATFDLPYPTFRHKEFKEYKAQRPKTPPELSQQITTVKEVLTGFGVSMLEKEGFEADDLIGTISAKVSKIKKPEVETIILSGDLDVLQLVDSQTKVYTFKKGVKETVLYDEKLVKERYGLKPHQLPDFKGLRGDVSDNIPGVPGIGEKTALKLIQQAGSLEKLYQHLAADDLLLKASLKTKLLEYKEQAFLSKKLSEIKEDVAIDFELKKSRWGQYENEEVSRVLKNLDFYSLVKRIPELKKKNIRQQMELC